MTRVELSRPVPADHPAFDGHFPGQPLLPGVALLAEVLEAARTLPALAAMLHGPMTLAQAKFLSPVRPGSVLQVALDAGDGALGFEVHCNGAVAAKGRWTWTTPAR